MKSTELRIGNYVLNDNCLCRINHIMFSDYCIVKTKQNNEITARYELLKSIELSEEWLEQLGFKRHNNAWVLPQHLRSKNCVGFDFSVWKDLTYNTAEIRPPLDYVHQLQNLYYALTGEELSLSGI